MAGQQLPLDVIIRAIDRITAPVRAISATIDRLTSPVRRVANSLRSLAEQAGLPRLMEGFAGVGRGIGRVAGEVARLARRIGIVTAAAAVGLFALVRRAEEGGDALAKISARTGFAVDTFAAYQHAAGLAGITQDQFNTSIDQFSKRVGELKAGQGSLLGLLKAVSPAFALQLKGTKSNEEALRLMFAAMARLDDPRKRAALAAAAFGRAGLAMANMVQNGTGEIDEAIAEYKRLMGQQAEFARQSELLNDEMARAELAFMGVRNAALAELFPAFTELARILKEFFVANREDVRAWARDFAVSVAAFARDLPRMIRELVAGFRDLVAAIDPVARALGGWPMLLGAIAAVVVGGPLLAAIASFTAAIISLGVAIGLTPIGWFLAGIAALGAVAALLVANWKDVGPFFSDLFGGIRENLAGLLNIMAGIGSFNLRQIIGGLNQFGAGANTFGRTLLGLGGGDARPSLGASNALPTPSVGGGGGWGEGRIKVDFLNVMRGVRVSEDPRGTAPLDLSVGYSMIEAR